MYLIVHVYPYLLSMQIPVELLERDETLGEVLVVHLLVKDTHVFLTEEVGTHNVEPGKGGGGRGGGGRRDEWRDRGELKEREERRDGGKEGGKRSRFTWYISQLTPHRERSRDAAV